MSANKIDQIENTMEEAKICGRCWHFVNYIDPRLQGFCSNKKSKFSDRNVDKNSPACKQWNLKTIYNFWS